MLDQNGIIFLFISEFIFSNIKNFIESKSELGLDLFLSNLFNQEDDNKIKDKRKLYNNFITYYEKHIMRIIYVDNERLYRQFTLIENYRKDVQSRWNKEIRIKLEKLIKNNSNLLILVDEINTLINEEEGNILDKIEEKELFEEKINKSPEYIGYMGSKNKDSNDSVENYMSKPQPSIKDPMRITLKANNRSMKNMTEYFFKKNSQMGKGSNYSTPGAINLDMKKEQPVKVSLISKKLSNYYSLNDRDKIFTAVTKSVESVKHIRQITELDKQPKEFELYRTKTSESLITSTNSDTFIEEMENEIKQSNIENIIDCIGKPLKENVDIIPTTVIQPTFNNEEQKEDFNIMYDKKTSEIRNISIDLLLKKIAVEGFTDNNHKITKDFISQYHCFIKTEVLLDKIINLYNFYKEKEIIPIGILRFLNNIIIFKYEEEISKTYDLKEKFKEFYEKLIKDSDTNNAVNLNDVYDLFQQQNKFDIEYSIKHLKGRKKSSIISFKMENQTIPESLSNTFDILEWPEIEIARQLTLISHQLFSKIEYKELLGGCWTKKDKYMFSPSVMKVIDRFNNLTLWMLEEILSYDKKLMRAGVLEKLINIANECRNICNFNDCVNIVSALNNFILKQLKKTWKLVKPATITLLNDLNTFCSYEKNYYNLRQEMWGSKGKPCVPYLGLLLKDLAFIEEGPKYIKDNYLINIDKVTKVADSINNFLEFKHQAYLYRPIPQLFVLSDPQPKCEDELERIANKTEPVFLLHKGKTKKKRITNTDSTLFKLNPSREYLFRTKDQNINDIIDDHF